MRTRTGRQPAPWGIGFGALNGMAKKALSGPSPGFSLNLLASLSSAVTFSRGTNATMFDSQGRLVWAPANLNAYTESYGGTGWTANGTPTVTSVSDAPIGFSSSVELTVTAANHGYFGAVTINRNLVAGASYVFSVWAKAVSGNSTVAFQAGGSVVTAPATAEWSRVSAVVVAVTSTPALYLNGAGTIRYAGFQIEPAGVDSPKPYVATSGTAYYGPRFDYDPLTLAARGLLIEGQRTNLSIGGNTWSPAAGSTATGSKTAVSVMGLSNDAYVLTETASVSPQTAGENGISTTAAAHVISVFVKAGTANRCQLACSAVVSSEFANFSLSGAGTVLLQNASSTAAIVQCADGWYRISMSFTASAGGGQIFVSMINADTAGRLVSYAGTGLTLLICHGQCEAATFPSSPIPTFGTAATRNSDYPTISGTNFSSWYNQTAGTFVVEGDVAATTADTSSRVIFGTSAGSFNDSLYLARQTALANIAETVLSGGVSQAALVGGTTSPNTAFKVAYAYAASDFAISVNGGAAVTQASGSLPATQVQAAVGVSAWGNNNNLFGHIRKVTYYPIRQSNAQLQVLSA